MKTMPMRDGIKTNQQGFSLISAIFLLVVLAGLGAAMLSFSTVQNQTSAMDVLGSRAYQAAHAGVEWGAYQVLRNGGACAPSTNLPALAGTLNGFSVNVACVVTAHSDVSATTGTVSVYQLTSLATQGAAGTANYVERQVQATIAQ